MLAAALPLQTCSYTLVYSLRKSLVPWTAEAKTGVTEAEARVLLRDWPGIGGLEAWIAAWPGVGGRPGDVGEPLCGWTVAGADRGAGRMPPVDGPQGAGGVRDKAAASRPQVSNFDGAGISELYDLPLEQWPALPPPDAFGQPLSPTMSACSPHWLHRSFGTTSAQVRSGGT
jgi:hypothetical protein